MKNVVSNPMPVSIITPTCIQMFYPIVKLFVTVSWDFPLFFRNFA